MMNSSLPALPLIGEVADNGFFAAADYGSLYKLLILEELLLAVAFGEILHESEGLLIIFSTPPTACLTLSNSPLLMPFSFMSMS